MGWIGFKILSNDVIYKNGNYFDLAYLRAVCAAIDSILVSNLTYSRSRSQINSFSGT